MPPQYRQKISGQGSQGKTVKYFFKAFFRNSHRRQSVAEQTHTGKKEPDIILEMQVKINGSQVPVLMHIMRSHHIGQ